MSFKTLSTEYISQHQYFTARSDRYETADGKIVDPYFVVELPTSVCAVAITEKNEVIMVKQYRHPLGEQLLEIPGGFVDAGETSHQAIERELLEETGHSFTSFHYLGITAANPGVLNNYTHMFLALGGKQTTVQSLDDNEEIEIIFKPLEELREMLFRNEITQSMHALCMFYAFEFIKRNELIG